ncbi:MAG: sulfurtransferase [Bryobacterales bacterium]|nr:sulfurtransferase [Bryobacterales bacterium]
MIPRFLMVALLLIGVAPLLPAQGIAGSEMLVSGAWLEGQLRNEKVVILHVGTLAGFEEAHIPGARLLRLEDITVTGTGGLRMELPRVDALETAFARLGVTDDATVVLYHVDRALQTATRAWFTLDYLGLGGRTAILDGGLALWRKEGRPLSKEPVPPAGGSFTPRPAPVKVASAEWIRMHLQDSGVMILDARTPEFYSGSDKGAMARGGHIPGAISAPLTSFLDEEGRLQSRDVLRELLRVGQRRPEPVRVTYCHSGVQATVPYFAGRYLGLDMRLFDGSFQDWSQRAGYPVEQGTAEAR